MASRIFIDRNTLKDALTSINKAFHRRRRFKERAILRSINGELIISVEGLTIRVPCIGSWDYAVEIPTRFVVRLGAVLPNVDPVPVELKDGKLRFASCGIAYEPIEEFK